MGSPYTWGDYTEKIVSTLLARHVSATTIICINDPYDYAESIKDDERQLRIQGQGPIPNVYIKPADLFPTNCKSKLSSQRNHIPSVRNLGEDCVSLSTGDTKDNLSFSQGEVDTIMLSVYAALR